MRHLVRILVKMREEFIFVMIKMDFVLNIKMDFMEINMMKNVKKIV